MTTWDYITIWGCLVYLAVRAWIWCDRYDRS